MHKKEWGKVSGGAAIDTSKQPERVYGGDEARESVSNRIKEVNVQKIA